VKQRSETPRIDDEGLRERTTRLWSVLRLCVSSHLILNYASFYYRTMLCRLCDNKLPVRPSVSLSVRLWRSRTVIK